MAQTASASVTMHTTLLPGAVLLSDLCRIKTDKALPFHILLNSAQYIWIWIYLDLLMG